MFKALPKDALIVIKFSIPSIFVLKLIFEKYCLVAVFFPFAPHRSHVFVNTHKFKSSEMILPNSKDYFPYSPFVNVYLETRIITIGAELTQF